MVAQYSAGRGALLLALGYFGCSGDDLIVPAPPLDNSVRLQEIASGLDMPVFLTSPPGDHTRLFVVEQGGRIRIVRNGALLTTPFLDISAKVSNGGEQGLLGLAFHPDYAANGRFIVNYTDGAGDTRVSVYRVSSNPEVADPASEQVILAIDQPFSNHNGGMVVFGPDGKLYIGTGDGGSGGDPQNHGQNRNSLLGKLLRVTVDGNGAMTVPADNPFVGQAGIRPEIWSYGLRNPWRFSFDRQTGDLYIGDVGQNQREEIDVSTQAAQFGKGLNYGWRTMEGNSCFSPSIGCARTGLVLPVLEYTHNDGCSVAGGYVYRGSALTALAGTYFYADYCGGWVRSFRLAAGQVTDQFDWTSLWPGGQVLSFGEDGAGELYLLTSAGKVHKIVPAP
ncbi:MAG: glucose dehydrogenase [Gemmatimonadales bacterium]|nr:glucose dehydrogenase [Gemmatimonadales bacterium]